MIGTKDLVCFMKIRVGKTFRYADIDKEMVFEIIKRLRAYDRICHDLEQLIATLSNVID